MYTQNGKFQLNKKCQVFSTGPDTEHLLNKCFLSLLKKKKVAPNHKIKAKR